MTDELNSIVDIKKFFDDPDHPVTGEEFREFWESLTEEEKLEIKKAELPK